MGIDSGVLAIVMIVDVEEMEMMVRRRKMK